MNNTALTERGSPRLRPGAEVLEVSEDKLHILFPNQTVTFTTPPVTRAVRALVRAMEDAGDEDTLVALACQDIEAEPELVRYILGVMTASDCLYWIDPTAACQDRNELYEFHAMIGQNAQEMKDRLAAVRPLIFTSVTGSGPLGQQLSAAGVEADVVPLRPGTPIAAIGELLQSAAAHPPPLLVCWDIPYRSPAAKAINELSLNGTPALFGACEGLIGRVGPYIIPRVSPCLECLNARLLSHAGLEELSAFKNYRLQNSHSVAREAPKHPVFLQGVAAFFVIELMQILVMRPPTTLGGFVEYGLTDGSVLRRTVLKAPRCSACHAAKPARFAWNTTFASPRVKGATLDEL